MPPLYLDTNIFSYLHYPDHYQDKPWHAALSPILNYIQNVDHPVLVYSPAHLMDLRKGYLKEPEQALDNLRFLGHISRNQRIAKYFQSDEIALEPVDPEAFFLQDTKTDPEFHAPGLHKLNLLPLVQCTPAYEKYKDKNLDFDKVKHVLAAIPIKLKRTKRNPNVFSLMCDFAVFISDMINDKFDIYKPFRAQAIKETGIAGKLADFEDPISTMHTLLLATSLGQRILEGMTEIMAEDPNNREGIIFSLFMNLDFLGFKKDKLTPRHGYMSIAADATHCFYASYCDIFVTNDEKTGEKSKAVYKYLQLKAQVFGIQDLADWIRDQ